MGELHPSLGLPTSTPLATLALWDNERLKKLGRMKAEPGSPKAIVRGFAKLVLALRELSDTANGQDVPSVVSSVPAAATLVFLPPLHDGALEPLPLVPVAKIHSGKRSRAAPVKSAENKQGCHDIFLDCESPSLPSLGWLVSRQGHSPPHLCRCSARGATWALSLLISSWCSSLGSLCRCSLSWWSPCSRTHCSSAALSGSCFSGRRNQCTNIDRCRPRFGHLRRECSICHCPNFLHRVPDRLSIMILPIQPQPSSCRQHPLSLRIGESGSCVISSLVRLVLPRTGSLQGPGPSVSCVLRHEFGRSPNSEPLSAALVCRAAVCITIDVVSSSAL